MCNLSIHQPVFTEKPTVGKTGGVRKESISCVSCPQSWWRRNRTFLRIHSLRKPHIHPTTSLNLSISYKVDATFISIVQMRKQAHAVKEFVHNDMGSKWQRLRFKLNWDANFSAPTRLFRLRGKTENSANHWQQ